jgi:uncharacterized protein
MSVKLITELRKKRSEIIAVMDRHGAVNVRVFGSVAREEPTAQSDIDFLVDWDYDRISAWGGAGLVIELEQILDRRVDVVSETELHWYIRDEVLKEAIPL